MSNKLKVFFDTDDYTSEAENYIQDTFDGTMQSGNYLWVGYFKPINAVYVGIDTGHSAYVSSEVVTVEYYNGSTFTDVTNLTEGTRHFTRSGWLSWDRNQTDEAATTENSEELYWYRIEFTGAEYLPVTFSGVNLLLSDDIMLKEDEPHLLNGDYYPAGETSFIGFHQSARNEIVQRLRNEGNGTYANNIYFDDLTVFDLLDYTQLSLASKYSTLSKIFFNLSDSVEDKYYAKYRDYQTMYNDAFNVFFLSIDKNDDGLQNEVEKSSFQSGIIVRV